jgi:hypothetical protein
VVYSGASVKSGRGGDVIEGKARKADSCCILNSCSHAERAQGKGTWGNWSWIDERR